SSRRSGRSSAGSSSSASSRTATVRRPRPDAPFRPQCAPHPARQLGPTRHRMTPEETLVRALRTWFRLTADEADGRLPGPMVVRAGLAAVQTAWAALDQKEGMSIYRETVDRWEAEMGRCHADGYPGRCPEHTDNGGVGIQESSPVHCLNTPANDPAGGCSQPHSLTTNRKESGNEEMAPWAMTSRSE